MAIRNPVEAKEHHARKQAYDAMYFDITPEFAKANQGDYLAAERVRDYMNSNAPNVNTWKVALKKAKEARPNLKTEYFQKMLDLMISDFEIESAHWAALGW